MSSKWPSGLHVTGTLFNYLYILVCYLASKAATPLNTKLKRNTSGLKLKMGSESLDVEETPQEPFTGIEIKVIHSCLFDSFSN